MKIEIDDKEMRLRLHSQLTKYLGSKEKVKIFAKECRAIGLELGDVNVIKNIAQNPEWFTTLINYSELGLLPKLGKAVTKLNEIN